ncbi:MAG: hypothetical protein JWO44_830 [Bacteroidetes bacterium]|nr:hypothetical protein [Bacteroidota bacterium]
MRHALLFIITAFFISHVAFAQDTIMKTNGEVIQAKITEVGPLEIKYKKFSFQDGPTYVENRSEISYIKYSNGIKEQISSTTTAVPVRISDAGTSTDYYDPNVQKELHVDKMQPYGAVKYKYQGRKIGENEMQRILMKTQDRQIVPLIQGAKDAHKLQFLGFAAIPLGIGALFVLEAGAINNNGRLSTGTVTGSLLLVGGAIACPIISGVFKHKRTTYNRKAVELYNQKY